MFSQLLWMHNYHTFHGNQEFAWENDSQEIFICIETCQICTSYCNNCMWKGRCKVIHTLALFIHNWKHKLNKAHGDGPNLCYSESDKLLSLTPKQQTCSESFCLPTLKKHELAWTSLSLGGGCGMGEVKWGLFHCLSSDYDSPYVIKSLWELQVKTAGPSSLFALI